MLFVHENYYIGPARSGARSEAVIVRVRCDYIPDDYQPEKNTLFGAARSNMSANLRPLPAQAFLRPPVATVVPDHFVDNLMKHDPAYDFIQYQ